MTFVFNEPAEFKAQAIDGFAAAFERYVQRVPNASGFLRSGGPRAGKVSLVVGGGSGHYPSYGGIVGPGVADACVLGDVFTSPSAEQIYRVARAAHGGAGIMLAFGNYAGDRLNFGAAQERLLEEGIDARTVYVTDDVASAPPEEADKRRGIAATFAVYKIGGSAADAGYSLDDVERVMNAANLASFSIGVAFAGCTLPGQSEPLFKVEPGQMELGLGVHGEPGIRSEKLMPADDLARTLVELLLAERPSGSGDRAAVIVNGLGATKYEELFLLYGDVHRRLTAAGIQPVMPEVGELISSLDMAGCSISLTWLDEEIEELWAAPAHSVAFRRGDSVAESSFAAMTEVEGDNTMSAESAQASEASIEAAGVVRRAFAEMARTLHDSEQRLGRMDAIAGDGDHGAGMVRGIDAALEAVSSTDGGAGHLLQEAGAAFGDRAGGTSGNLWGVLLATVGRHLGDVEVVDGPRLAAALRAASDELQRIGGARLGDKTMLDALIPFVDHLDGQLAEQASIGSAWATAAEVANAAALETASLKANIGRARPLAERSIGTPDPGATSMAIVLTAVGEVLQAEEGTR